ncbi:MAG: hypothetical protein IJK67_06310 [Bacilli bacterium]|nr:hypothetical protein [Bacilli bacterium]
MNNRNRKVLAIAMSLSMIFNGANAKVKKDVYLPVEPLTIESQLDNKGRKLKKQNKNM